jgi:hypothetical protein
MGYGIARAYEDARQYQRFPTHFEATLVIGDQSMFVWVADISRAGAMIRAANLPATGTLARLVARALDVTATVAWRGEAECGLNFRAPVDPLHIVRQNVRDMAYFRILQERGPRSRS